MTETRQRAMDIISMVPEENLPEVINMIISFKEDDAKVDYESVDSAYGMLSEYADSNKIPLEEGAFERAMVKKHEID